MDTKDIKIEIDDDMEEIPATPEEMKAEAIDRLHMLKIFPETIRQFETDGLVSISEPPIGAHYWANDEIQKIIDSFQREYNSLVYYGIRTFTNIGEMYSLFYVYNMKSEWEMDRDDMTADQQCVYVYNKDDPELSEIGAIGYEHTAAGSLQRIW